MDPVIPALDFYKFLTAEEILERKRALRSELDKRQVHIIRGTDSKIPGYKGRELQVLQVVRPRSENPLQCKVISIWVPVEQFEAKDTSVTIQKGRNTVLDKKIKALDEGKTSFFADDLRTEESVVDAIKGRDDPRKKPLRR
ncbi:hypothetical protein D4R42_04220 [bacterium]|nr:MAG: hypothetical protein D4R42_04220 [bacterium]